MVCRAPKGWEKKTSFFLKIPQIGTHNLPRWQSEKGCLTFNKMSNVYIIIHSIRHNSQNWASCFHWSSLNFLFLKSERIHSSYWPWFGKAHTCLCKVPVYSVCQSKNKNIFQQLEWGNLFFFSELRSRKYWSVMSFTTVGSACVCKVSHSPARLVVLGSSIDYFVRTFSPKF